MKRMTGIILMIIGLLTFLGGFVFYKVTADTGPRNSESNPDSLLAKSRTVDSLKVVGAKSSKYSFDSNVRIGYNFEKYVVQKFNKKYFTIKDWTSDKSIDGTYAESSTYPDLIIELKLEDKKYPFSVECKWRSNIYKGGVEFTYPDQLKRYKDFEKKRKMPVFLAIGVGGESKTPEKLYIVPLREIDTTFLTISQLADYEKDVNEGMYFDIEKQVLK